MIYTISNNNYTAKISDVGAELKSFKDNNRQEYIWEGKPEIWSGTAPILFPIVGQLKNDEYTYSGNKYHMDKHGFARRSTFKVHKHEDATISFILESSEETQHVYPFEFELIVEFGIENGILTVSYFVLNTGEKNMYFTIGSHPAFTLDTNNYELSDYYIEFEKKELLDCYVIEDGLFVTDTIPRYLDDYNTIQLSESIFDNDALIFKNITSKQISIKNDKSNFNITIVTGGAPHLGIWAKPRAPYVCIEPWYGFADNVDANGELSKKESMIKLKSGQSFSTGYQIRVN